MSSAMPVASCAVLFAVVALAATTAVAQAPLPPVPVVAVTASTTAYSSYQISERNQPSRWRVSQTLALEGADFSALVALISKIQSDDGLVLSGMNFAVS